MVKYYPLDLKRGRKFIARCPETKQYLHMSCTRLTTDRTYAWTGYYHQIAAMLDKYPLGSKMKITEDK